jgi:uncharacterized membrane protein
MLRLIILYVATLAVMVALDFLFLGMLAKGFFQSNVGEMMKEPNFAAAAMFYAFYAAGIVIFVNSAASTTWQQTLLFGALFGLLCYGTFDLTMLSIIKGWQWKVAAVDMSWGAFATAGAGTLGLVISRLVIRQF